MEVLKKVFNLKIELDKLRPIDKEQEAIIMSKFRLDWNYHSNKIEGNSLTYGETKALILFGITAQGKPLKDHFEITGHNEAIKWVEDLVHQNVPITEYFIRQLHQLVLKESYEVEAETPTGERTKKRIQVGSYKTTPNHVLTKTGEIFRFATPEETPSKMHDLIEWFRKKQTDTSLNPIVLAAEFHYKFIRIHPFDDGNGRIARILMNLILMQNGFPPVIIKTEDKASYFSVLQMADAGILEPFFEYIAKNTVYSLEIMIRGAKGESIDEPDDLDKELALLERKLRSITSHAKENTKNKEVIINICIGSLKKVFDKIVKRSESFLRFYPYFLHEIRINSISALFYYPPVNKDFKDILEREITNETDLITLHSQFSTSLSNDDSDFTYSGDLVIKFSTASYSINDKISKSYNEQLTENEIDELVEIELKKHKDFIAAKISEIQKNAGN